MVKHTLPQTVECAEKHVEFVTENYHEVLEKLDELVDEGIISEEDYKMFSEIVGPSVDKLCENVYDIKTLIYRYTKTSDIALLREAISLIRKTRRMTRDVRKLYQSIKEKLFEKLAEYVSTFSAEVKERNDICKIVNKIKATLIEIKYGRRNLYALEEHLTDLQKHLVSTIKKQQVSQQAKKEENRQSMVISQK